MSVGVARPAFKPLKLKCTQTDCASDLHCFLQKTQKPRPHGGPCRSCGEDLIDFPRVQARDLRDISNTFSALAKEWIRHEFWERPFDIRALNHARRKGMRALREQEVFKRIRQSVGRVHHPMEGRQTPFEGNTIFYAQHAVAACCRRCVEYWHGIPSGVALTDAEVAYLSALVLLYLQHRLEGLNEEPMKVPPLRATRSPRPVLG